MPFEVKVLKTARCRLKLEGSRATVWPGGHRQASGATPFEPRNALDHRIGRGLQAGPGRLGRARAARASRSTGCRGCRRGRSAWSAGWRPGRATAGSPLPWNGSKLGCGGAVAVDRPEVFWRASGLNRPGMIAHLTAPRLATRLAIGIENALAHAVVDRLLGFDRAFAESRLQLTPVEWGIWTFLILRALDALDAAPTAEDRRAIPDEARSLGPGDLTTRPGRARPVRPDGPGLDRDGPLGRARRDRERLGAALDPGVAGAATAGISARRPRPGGEPIDGPSAGAAQIVPRGELSSLWRAEAGTVAMPQGLKRLRVGGVLPLTDSRLSARPPARPGRSTWSSTWRVRRADSASPPAPSPTRAGGSSASRTACVASLVPATRSWCPSRKTER